MKNEGAVVTRVLPNSLAEEMGIEQGDKIIRVNDQLLEDVIDLQFMLADEYIEVEVQKPDGDLWLLEADKEIDEELGVELAADTFDGIHRCQNRCVFCFVDQMPPGMRESLYIKDDDYRMSFLHGNFITGTNLREADINRILRLRLSPVYISVHTTNPDLRVELVHNPQASNILKQLTALVEQGIDVHTQIVLCPELNDGAELDRTITDLSNLWPGVRSIAVVPVGLTNYRSGLTALQTFNQQRATQVVEQVSKWQQQFMEAKGYPLVFLGDEFYLLAEQPIPVAKWYADYPQLENGVGLVRQFYDSFAEVAAQLPEQIQPAKNFLLITGMSGAKVLPPVVERLNQVAGLKVQVIPIENQFFGEKVTVAGLITGRDILHRFETIDQPGTILIPSVMVKAGEDLLLDGLRVSELAKQLDREILIIDVNAGAEDLVKEVVR